MKKAAIIIILFALYTAAICKIPAVTKWDTAVIVFIQQRMSLLPDWLSFINSQKLYYTMIYLPLAAGVIYFAIKKMYADIVILAASPYIAYGFNTVFKNIISRPRPPIELQTGIHTNTYSYVSSHTIITMCLWGMIIFYVNKYCKNKILKTIITLFSITWILLLGFSRVLTGVHNPTDVIGAYILGAIFLIFYIKAANLTEKRNKDEARTCNN